MTDPIGARMDSWSRRPGSGGDQWRRTDSAGGMATMARRARTAEGLGVAVALGTATVATTPSGPWSTPTTGDESRTRSPSSSAMASGALLGTGGEPSLLGAVGGAGQVHEAAAGMEVEEGEEQGELARLGAEDALDGGRDDGPGPVGGDRGGQPRPEGLLVAGPGVGRLPGGLEGDLRRRQVQLEDGLDAVGGGGGVGGGDETGVGGPVAVAPFHALARGEGGEGVGAVLVGQLLQLVLAGADPLTAVVDQCAGGRRPRPDPTADTVTGLDHEDVDPGPRASSRAADSPA